MYPEAMRSRSGYILLAAAFSLSVSGARGAVLSIPPALAAPGGLGAQAGGLLLSPAVAASGLGLVLPSALSLTPALAAAPAVALTPAALNAAVVAAPAIPDRVQVPAGRVRMIRDFDSRILGNRRDVAIYLPPGYGETNARYPVLYMQDGQNVFDPATAYGGSDWRLAQTLDRLIASGEMEPVIVIAAYNTPGRIGEYTPVADAGYGGGGGDAYGRFLSDELKPFVDANLRTRPGAENTAVMGSSLGGLISLHLAFTRPDIFSRAAALSPSLWWAEGHMTRWTRRSPLPEPRPRLWIDMGTEEGETAADHASNIEGLRAFNAALHERGWRAGAGLEAREIESAGHNEAAWRDRAAAVLKFIFPRAPSQLAQ
jgi:predicted alpha/beta superfamily hydrolase